VSTTSVSPDRPREPFSDMPAQLPDRLRSFLGVIVEDVVREVQRGVPEYAHPDDEACVRTLRAGTELALSLFLDRMDKPEGGRERSAATYREVGRGEAEQGRGMGAFQSAMRLGAQVAWRRFSTLADEEVLPRSVLVSMGEAMLVHLDEIIEAARAGHAEARLRTASELQRRRGRLLSTLIADPPPSAEAISDLAQAAQWQVPRQVAVVLVDGEDAEAPWPVTPPEVLVRTDGRPVCMVVPDPDGPDPDGPGPGRLVAPGLPGRTTVVGPTVAVTDAGRSARVAADALALVRRGIIPAGDVVHCAEHLSTLLLFRDEALMAALARRHLAPLDRVRAPSRHRLAETLLVWLRCGHNTIEVGRRLGIHPQTVRYRLRQLEELFGDRLQDPDTLFELELVLRAGRLRRAARPEGGDGGDEAEAGPIAG
jgi:DNA-binding CsgD family transcriptional regulator